MFVRDVRSIWGSLSEVVVGGGGGILRGSGEIVGDLRIRAVLCDGGSWVVVWSERKWVGSCRLCL